MKRAFVILLLTTSCAACSDGEGQDASVGDVVQGDALPKDADADAGLMDADAAVEPDRDQDGVSDDNDNCVDLANTDQADEDDDNIGDVCDPCKATPFSAERTCTSIQEVEPNNNSAEAQMIPFFEQGTVLEILGTAEAPPSGGVPSDRFRFVVPESPTLLIGHVRIARRAGAGAFEPFVEIEWLSDAPAPSFAGRTRREAEGATIAERDFLLYSSSPPEQISTFEVRIADRRSWHGPSPVGGENFDYVLTLEHRALDLENDFERVGPVLPEMPVVKTYTLEPAGSLKFLRADYEDSMVPPIVGLGGIDISTSSRPGIDPIAVIPGNTAIAAQNDNWRPDTTDARLGHNYSFDRQFFVLDHRRINGPNLEVTVTLMHNVVLEREPNNTFATAHQMATAGYVLGRASAPAPDEDWVQFWSAPGELIVLECNNATSATGDPLGDIQFDFYAVEQGVPRFIEQRRDTLAPRDPILAYLNPGTAESYAFNVTSENPSDVWLEPDKWYSCSFESRGVMPGLYDGRLSTTSTITDDLGGGISVWELDIAQPTHLEINTTTAAAGIEPYLRVYGPRGLAIFAEGSMSVSVDLEAETEPYILFIDNGNDGLPGLGGSDFEIQVTMTPR